MSQRIYTNHSIWLRKIFSNCTEVNSIPLLDLSRFGSVALQLHCKPLIFFKCEGSFGPMPMYFHLRNEITLMATSGVNPRLFKMNRLVIKLLYMVS